MGYDLTIIFIVLFLLLVIYIVFIFWQIKRTENSNIYELMGGTKNSIAKLSIRTTSIEIFTEDYNEVNDHYSKYEANAANNNNFKENLAPEITSVSYLRTKHYDFKGRVRVLQSQPIFRINLEKIRYKLLQKKYLDVYVDRNDWSHHYFDLTVLEN